MTIAHHITPCHGGEAGTPATTEVEVTHPTRTESANHHNFEEISKSGDFRDSHWIGPRRGISLRGYKRSPIWQEVQVSSFYRFVDNKVHHVKVVETVTSLARVDRRADTPPLLTQPEF